MTGQVYVEIFIMAVVILYVMQHIGGVSVMKFVDDNAIYFQKLKEDDFAFYCKARYGDAVDIDALFNNRLKMALYGGLGAAIFFINNFNILIFINC